MNSRLPESLEKLIHSLSRLPGLGPKSAMRVAMTLLKWPEDTVRQLGQHIATLRDTLQLCQECGALTEKSPCTICTNPNRQDNLLCVVADWDSLLTIEDGAFFQGRYCILGGLLMPLENIQSEHLELDRLYNRLNKGQVEEVVLALGATIEADNTAIFLHNLIKKRYPNIQITRLAQGIPLGAEVKFMDKETLRQSLEYRQDLRIR